jgi:hypothetical protein
MNKFTGFLAKTAFWTKRNKPELLITLGIVSAASSIYFAIKATPKAEQILKNANDKISVIKADMKDDNKISNKQYSLVDGRRDLTKIYLKTAYEIGKVYTPTALGFGVTVASVIGSHRTMKSRNVGLVAAYTTLNNGYQAYRARVAESIGEKAEQELYRDTRKSEKTLVEFDKDTGKEVLTTKVVNGAHANIDNDFCVMFDRNADDWDRNTNNVLTRLALRQKYLNAKLATNGFLFLNDVYKELGIDVSTLGEGKLVASRVLGWIYDPSDDTRDSYISFGLFDQNGNRNEYAMELLRTNAQEIFLEFNVDGDILLGQKDGKNFAKYGKVL